MGMFDSMHATASALTGQRLRMDVISSNMANADSTRSRRTETGEWEPYKLKVVVLQEKNGSFNGYLNKAMGRESSAGQGVMVSEIKEDDTPFEMVYDPDHPDAGEDGYVAMPNVDPLREQVDLLSATRSYEANVTVFNASKNMLLKALEIGK